MTEDVLAQILGLDKVLIGGAVENTAKEGATATMARLFAKDALLVYAAPRPSLMLPWAATRSRGPDNLGAGANGARIKRFRMESIASDRIEGEMAYDMKLVAADLGVFFSNVIS